MKILLLWKYSTFAQKIE